MNHDKYLTVEALTKYLKFKFDSDEHLRFVFLKGEISNLKKHTTGHYYFSIKDEHSKINAIMFSRNTRILQFIPEDGMHVLVRGRVSVYEGTGSYQIYVESMEEDGIGNLYVQFEKLKKKLEQEGLFATEHKQQIPKIPTRVGIITAETGAAIRDIISTIRRRFPICETLLFPSLVQGENAAVDIVRNINRAQEYQLDVLIVGRGGGSLEDLWSFNEEIVARAIYESKVPIVSAVGHEVDFTIADFVADLRAPTPTGAAEMVVPNLPDLQNHLGQLMIRCNECISKKVNVKRLQLENLMRSFILKNPMILYENKKQYLDILLEKIRTTIIYIIEKKRDKLIHMKSHYLLQNPENLYQNERLKLKNIIEKLQIINPLNTLERGYSIAYKKNILISHVCDVSIKDHIKIKMQDGEIFAEVLEIRER